jgi:hypothetical protein
VIITEGDRAMPRNTVEPEKTTSNSRSSLARLVATKRPRLGLLRAGHRILRSYQPRPIGALRGGLAISAAPVGAGLPSGVTSAADDGASDVAKAWSKMPCDRIFTGSTLGQARG